MTLAQNVGPDLAAFLRWLVQRGDWELRELLDVIDDPAAWEIEWREWQENERRACASPEGE